MMRDPVRFSLGLLAVSVTGLIWALIPVSPPNSTLHQADKRVPRFDTSVRPVYPYSVLRGGAYDAGELEARRAADKVAARHYETFSRTHVITVKASSDRRVYMSYRKGSQIYWTKKTVQLHVGEALLSDGVHYIRARCGNRISEAPQEPTEKFAAAAPSELLLDMPESWEIPPRTAPLDSVKSASAPPAARVPELAPSDVPAAPRLILPAPIGILPPTGPTASPQENGSTTPIRPSIPITVIPEPGSLVLLGTAFAVIAAVYHRARRQKRRANGDPCLTARR